MRTTIQTRQDLLVAMRETEVECRDGHPGNMAWTCAACPQLKREVVEILAHGKSFGGRDMKTMMSLLAKERYTNAPTSAIAGSR